MMTIYYFNPENDLALANGGLNYTAPPRAAQLRHDLRLLPAWLAHPGDLVLCHDDNDRQWLQGLGLDVNIITPDELPAITDARFEPWGWSRATRRTLQRMGAPEHLLPTTEDIEAVHRLSHRRTTIAFHQRMRQLTGIDYCPTPIELTTLNEVQQWAAEHPGCYLKLPWSGSGQGVYRVLSMEDEHLWQWCSGGLRRQGSLLCEIALDREQDFATEWYCHAGEVQLEGFSVFNSDFHHQYASGRVDTRQTLHDALVSRYPDLDLAVGAQRQVIAKLIAPHYDGHLGVDMMLYHQDDGAIGLDPCIEVNMRCTMGLVTCVLGERHQFKGSFHIIDTPPSANALPLTPQGHFTAVLMRQ